MRASRIVALSAFFLASAATVASADETGADKKQPTVIKIVIKGRRPIPSSVDVGRVVMRAPLPDLRKPLVDPASVVDRDPF